ncbi:MAG TPA: hypothetical protein VHX59_26900 [Mycobacteriales bacterium]|nr:hypothetical protein [Mycobacteriales bacterium]
MGGRISQRRGRTTGRGLLASMALGAAVLATGCASGQITQTSEEQPSVPGAEGSVGQLELHNVTVAYPDSGVYKPGSTARVNFVVVNSGVKADTLVGVSSGSAKTVRISGDSGKSVPVGPQASVNVYGDGPSVIMTGIVRPLRSAQQTTITFRFAKAGQVAISVPVAPAPSALPKTTLNPSD